MTHIQLTNRRDEHYISRKKTCNKKVCYSPFSFKREVSDRVLGLS